LKGRFNGYWIGELIFRGAYTWRGLFMEFYGTLFSTLYFQVSGFEKGFPNKVHTTIDLLNLGLCRDKMWK